MNKNHLLTDWIKDSTFYSRKSLSDEKQLTDLAEQKALQLFHSAAQEVPAYSDFLKNSDCNPLAIKTISDFEKIPVTTKENYIQKYPLSQLCFGGTLENASMISTSSGTTGKPHLWPRDIKTEIDGAFMHEYIFRNIYNIEKKKTLFINGFAMGNWIAGTFTYASCYLLQLKGLPLTVMTPGYSIEAVSETIESTSDLFDQIIVAGHAPFLKEIAEVVAENGWNQKQNILLLGTGQAITEKLRDYLQTLLNAKNKENAVVNVYGSADAALMGFETLDSINVRKDLAKDSQSMQRYFSSDRIPSLYNYDPRLVYFESEGGELIISKYSYCPLIRYNLRDSGGIIRVSEFKKKYSLSSQLPFVYLFGRDKFMVKLYGANIYSEHMQTAFSHRDMQSFVTGKYLSEVIYDDNNNQLLVCKVELKKGVPISQEVASTIRNVFIQEVRKINSEYNFIYQSMGHHTHPKIELYENEHPVHFPKGKIKKNA